MSLAIDILYKILTYQCFIW